MNGKFKKNIRGVGLFLALALATVPVSASHGPLMTTDRDSWVNQSLENLVSAGLVPQPQKPLGDLTNLEVADLTAQAAKIVLAENVPAPEGQAMDTPQASGAAGNADLGKLVEEFKDELAGMGLDMDKLEDRIRGQEKRSDEFAALQEQDLRRVGTVFSGHAHAYFDIYRGFGSNAVYGPMDNNDILTGDIILKSVPVPFVLFDADLRLTRTIGLYFADPIKPTYDLHWLSLTNVNEVANLTVGDFYQNYTPLTLWNSEVPVYTMVEPTSYNRVRKDVEELAYMDQGPQWHLRGLEAFSTHDLPGGAIFDSFQLQAMGGELRSESQYQFSDEYAGTEDSLSLFDHRLEIKGAGLLLFDDPSTADVPYIPTLFQTFAKHYQVGSLSGSASVTLQEGISLNGSGEWAGSLYQDDSQNPQSSLRDWAALVNGDLSLGPVHLTAKYLNIGPYFYSPGAQTNRFTPAIGTIGYLSNNENLDDGLEGYLDNYLFQGVGRPAFAPYDRMAENILPYGDSTPDREGFVLGFSADIGKDGWLHPQARCDVAMKELIPNYALIGSGDSILPADSQDPTAKGRTFEGYEGAIQANFAKALEGLPSTCDIAFDYKNQTTHLGVPGETPFNVQTFIVNADMGPFPGVPLFEGLVLSAAYEQAQSHGDEYVLNGLGVPPTLGEYVSYFDTAIFSGGYSLESLDITRTSWAFGLKCPLGHSSEIHGDWFINKYTWSDVPGFDRRDEIWRLTYEVSF